MTAPLPHQRDERNRHEQIENRGCDLDLMVTRLASGTFEARIGDSDNYETAVPASASTRIAPTLPCDGHYPKAEELDREANAAQHRQVSGFPGEVQHEADPEEHCPDQPYTGVHAHGC